MYTRWNMTFFLFLGLTGLGLLLYFSAKVIGSSSGGKRPLGILVASISSALAVCAAFWGINDISKVLNILDHPSSGFSSAIIGQIVAVVAGVIIFAKSSGDSSKGIWGSLGVIVSLCSVYTLFRSYAISSRPGIDTVFLFVLLMLIILLMSCILSASGMGSFRHLGSICLGLSVLCGAVLVIFVLRLKGLEPQDRVLSFYQVVVGRYKFLFWGGLVFSAVIPGVISAIALVRPMYFKYIKFYAPVYWLGVFLLSMLINQMPVIQNGVNNRVFF